MQALSQLSYSPGGLRIVALRHMDVSADSEPGSGLELLRDPDVLRSLAHPTRMKIYTAMVDEPLSSKDLAERFEQPLARVSYHVRTLADAGLLRAVRQTRRRGAIETHYRAIATLDVSDEVLAAAGPEVYAMIARASIREVADDTLDAVDRSAASAADFMLARGHFRVTAAGRARLFAELLDFYDRLAALEQELRDELAAVPDEATEHLNVSLSFYEGDDRAGRNSPFILLPTPEGAEGLPEQIPPRDGPG
jgi:DNA-binding transcriptional ArsR family regulator